MGKLFVQNEWMLFAQLFAKNILIFALSFS